MFLDEIFFADLMHGFPFVLHWVQSAGRKRGTEGCEIGLGSVGKADALILCLSVKGD